MGPIISCYGLGLRTLHHLAGSLLLSLLWQHHGSIRFERVADRLFGFLDSFDCCVIGQHHSKLHQPSKLYTNEQTVCQPMLCAQVPCQCHYLPVSHICRQRRFDSGRAEPIGDHRSLCRCHNCTTERSLAADCICLSSSATLPLTPAAVR